MSNLEEQIKAFARDPKNIEEHLAMMKVMRDDDLSASQIMEVLIASIILRFLKIPTKPGGS